MSSIFKKIFSSRNSPKEPPAPEVDESLTEEPQLVKGSELLMAVGDTIGEFAWVLREDEYYLAVDRERRTLTWAQAGVKPAVLQDRHAGYPAEQPDSFMALISVGISKLRTWERLKWEWGSCWPGSPGSTGVSSDT